MTWLIGNNKGFTFIELMVTVIVLTVGLVLIIQGFITAAGALNNMQDNIQAVRFLDLKMQELEASAGKDNGIKRGNSEGKFSSGAKDFNWSLEVIGVEKEKDLDLSEDLNEVRLKVSWQEKGLPKDLSAAAYLRNKKE